MLAYMQRRLRNYVMHSYRIKQASKYDYYRTPLFRKSMNVCYNIVRTLADHNLFSLAHCIRANAENLRLILPLEANASYYSSHETLQELIRLSHILQRQTQHAF
jgi:hypothetical protein